MVDSTVNPAKSALLIIDLQHCFAEGYIVLTRD